MARVLAESMNDTRAMQLDAERLELEQAIQVRARDPWILSPGRCLSGCFPVQG